jgi:hypothetical protein
MKKSLKIVPVVLLVLTVCLAQAQNQSGNTADDSSISSNDDGWNFTAAPYLLFPGMNGEIAMRGIPVEVDLSAGDIFSDLDFGMMLYFEAANDKWALTFDALYMNLGRRGETPITGRDARVDLKQLAVDVKGMYRLLHWLEAGIGFRVNVIDGSLNVAEGEIILPGNKVSMNQSWFDPLVVTRASTDFSGSKWSLSFLGDIGGFGIGSDFTWQAKPYVGYRFSKLFEMTAAYRWIGIDYETGTGQGNFKYDMTISGPEIGFLFHF